MPRPRHDLASQRVRLAAHARPLRRGPGQVQFGLDPGRGIVLTGLSEAEVGWLLTLSAAEVPAARRHGAGVLLGSATQWGLTVPRAAELVSELRVRRLVSEPAAPDRAPGKVAAHQHADVRIQHPARVCVLGTGPAASAIRDHLATLEPAGPAAAIEVCGVPAEADITILVVAEAVGAGSAIGWARSSVAHLPVVVHPHRVVVGPLVTGTTGPCLTCLDHYRRDRDQAWPLLVAQVDGSLGEAGTPVHIEPALSGVTAGLCAMVLSGFVSMGTAPVGLTWEVSLPWPRVIARRWAEHPACGHHGRRPGDLG
ncbi:MAG: hypothetical protein WA892_14165 [Ornithinimicrobium sp.]